MDVSDEVPSEVFDPSFDSAFHGRKRLQKSASATNDSTIKVDRKQLDTGEWMDNRRQDLRTYEYMCHLAEAKEWIEACIQEEIPQIAELDEKLRDGVILAKLARFFEPSCVKKIFESKKLQYRHSDNSNYFIGACRKAGLPEIFFFELTDIYDKKNIPKVIYCIHVLSHFLTKKGIAPKIKNLIGQIEFTNEEIADMEKNLDAAGVALPQFKNAAGALEKELKEPTPEELRQKFWEENSEKVVRVQSLARGFLARKAYQKKLIEDTARIVRLQAMARCWLARTRYRQRLEAIKSNEELFTKFQAFCRGYLIRKYTKKRRELFLSQEKNIISLQAHFRGFLARRHYRDTLAHYNNSENLAKVIKIQSYMRGKVLGRAYKALGNEEDIPVKAIQSFIHLFDDSEQDFEEELTLENLRQIVVKKIRENNNTEILLNELDIKIALLVKNRITLDEVIRTTKRPNTIEPEDSVGGPASSLGFTSLKSMDRETRNRLESYQNLFYILQTQPKYFARLIFLIKQSKLRNFVDHALLTTFNYANSAREEFLLLKLFQQTILNEMNSITDIGDFLRGNPIIIKMVVHYNRGAKEREYLRNLFQPLVLDIVNDDTLDLECDPVNIHRQFIREEESKTGQASKRQFDVSRTEALSDQEVRIRFESNMEQLQKYTKKFLDHILASLDRMPYGIRYIAKELCRQLQRKFPPKSTEDEEKILRVVGNLIYYRYMNPAVVAPEGFDVIEQVIGPMQRKNLAEISKILQQISVGKLFENELAYLSPLNSFLDASNVKMTQFFQECIRVRDPDEFFQMTSMDDLSSTQKPIIYIAASEIFNIHQLMMDTLDDIAQEPDDPIRLLLKQLGNPPSGIVTTTYVDTGKDEDQQQQEDKQKPLERGNEVTLTLSSAFYDSVAAGTIGNEIAVRYKNLFLKTKRFVLSIIRVQTGKNLLETLEKPVTEREEQVYSDLLTAIQTAQSQQSHANEAPRLFAELKAETKANLQQLEELYKKISESEPSVEKQRRGGIFPILKSNNYQDVLTSIGLDIRNKHRRRVQRRSELRTLNKTISNLQEKMKYLEEQKQTYQDYINSCMSQLTSNRKKQQQSGSSKFLVPFTPQWNHVQQLKKQGKVPQFGSYQYKAEVLYRKGVLLSVEGYSPKQFGHITMTISSDETGVFVIEVSILGLKFPQRMEIKLEDLLQYQYENQQIIPLFDGVAKVNVNLLIYLINKKFYR